MRIFSAASAAAVVCSLSVVTGCGSSGTQSAPAVVSGDVVLDWTVADTKDPVQCDDYGAATFDVIIDTVDGGHVGEFQASCDSFSIRIPIEPGRYVANAVLLDVHGHQVTTQIEVNPFTVDSDVEVVLPLDFPPSSIK